MQKGSRTHRGSEKTHILLYHQQLMALSKRCSFLQYYQCCNSGKLSDIKGKYIHGTFIFLWHAVDNIHSCTMDDGISAAFLSIWRSWWIETGLVDLWWHQVWKCGVWKIQHLGLGQCKLVIAVFCSISAPLCVQIGLCPSLYNTFHVLWLLNIWEIAVDRSPCFLLLEDQH